MPTTPAQKAAAVKGIRAAMACGKMSLRAACAKLGMSPSNFVAWSRRLDAAGGDAFAAFEAKKSTGRPPAFAPTEADIARFRWLHLAKGSMELAAFFAASDDKVSDASRSYLMTLQERALEAGKRPNFPPSVRRAFHITGEEKARFRSRKASHSVEMMTPRGLLWVDESGDVHDLLPGQLWELDDYSTNQPYTWTDPQTGEVNLGRQVLAAMDYASAGWIGFDHIGRERDAYRGEDIVRYLGRLFRAHGLPLFLRLERGSWESSFVHGLEVEGMAENWGALDALVTIRHTWKSKGKGMIESSFNPLQSWLSQSGRDIGRFRGEFELATKAWNQAKNTAKDARDLGFLTADESSAAHAAAAAGMNSRPRERRELGERISPDDLRARLGWHTTPFPEAEAWRLLPYRERRVVSQGLLTTNPGNGWPMMRWIVNGIGDLHLESGHAVLVAYDPARPDLGAYVANADRSHRNRAGWGMGQPILVAPAFEAAPQIDLSGKYLGGAIGARRKASAAVATSFRAITAAGRPEPREAMATDGRGNTFLGSTMPAPESAPEIPAPTAERGVSLPESRPRGELASRPADDRGSRLDALNRLSDEILETL